MREPSALNIDDRTGPPPPGTTARSRSATTAAKDVLGERRRLQPLRLECEPTLCTGSTSSRARAARRARVRERAPPATPRASLRPLARRWRPRGARASCSGPHGRAPRPRSRARCCAAAFAAFAPAVAFRSPGPRRGVRLRPRTSSPRGCCRSAVTCAACSCFCACCAFAAATRAILAARSALVCCFAASSAARRRRRQARPSPPRARPRRPSTSDSRRCLLAAVSRSRSSAASVTKRAARP